MVFYHSFRETSVSQEFCRGGRDSEHFRYGECTPIRTVLTETLNVEHQLEPENLEAITSRSFIREKFESFQRQTDFQVQNRVSAKSRSNATASLTKLNPNANPFIPKSIEWEKLPLRPLDSSLSPLSSVFDFDLNERSVRSPIDEGDSFDSSDVLFMQPYPMDVSLQETRALSFPEYEPWDQQLQISGVDRHIFQDSAIVDSHMIHNFPNLREKMNYTETKCYHCGCVGHMAEECDIKNQGFDTVCFHCSGTGHKAAECPRIPKKEEFGIVETESPATYTSEILNQDTTPKGSPPQLGKIDIGEKTWNRNSNLGQRGDLENERLFHQILGLKI